MRRTIHNCLGANRQKNAKNLGMMFKIIDNTWHECIGMMNYSLRHCLKNALVQSINSLLSRTLLRNIGYLGKRREGNFQFCCSAHIQHGYSKFAIVHIYCCIRGAKNRRRTVTSAKCILLGSTILILLLSLIITKFILDRKGDFSSTLTKHSSIIWNSICRISSFCVWFLLF